jgi:hypothetical protein
MAFVNVDGDWSRTRAGSKGVWQGESGFHICVVFLGRERNSSNSAPTYWTVTETIHVTSSEQNVHTVGQVAMDHNARGGGGSVPRPVLTANTFEWLITKVWDV